MTSEDITELEGTPFIHDIQGVLTNMSEIKSRRRRDSSVGGSEVDALATESISSRNNSFSKKVGKFRVTTCITNTESTLCHYIHFAFNPSV